MQQIQHGVLTIASVGIGMAFTLVFGAQWGVMLGLLGYLVGSNMLNSRELAQLKHALQQTLDNLPDLVKELVEQRLSAGAGVHSAPMQTAPQPQDEPVEQASPPTPSELDLRFNALDSKLSALVELLAAREAAAPPTAPPSPAASEVNQNEKGSDLQHTPAASATRAASQSVAPHTAKEPPSPPSIEHEQPTAPHTIHSSHPSHQTDTKDKETELATMRELVDKMAAMLTRLDEVGSSKALEPPPQPDPAKNTTGTRSSYDHLRSELDRLSAELRNELGRPPRQ
jgi:hypothetical protein